MSQTHENLDIVVIDDGSSDSTPEIARSFPNVSVLEQENQGAPAARNTGLKKARGEYIVFLDSDDELHPEAIERQLRFSLEHCAANEVAYGNYRVISETGEVLKPFSNSLVKRRADVISRHILTSTPLHRTELVQAIGGWQTDIQRCQEWNLHVRLAFSGVKFLYSGVDVYSYRHHSLAHRISNATHESRIAAVNVNVLRLDQTLREVGNDANVLERAIFSGEYVKLARIAYAEGDPETSRQIFEKSGEISYFGRFYSNSRIFGLLCTVMSPMRSERIIEVVWRRGLKKLRGRIRHFLSRNPT